MKYFKLDDPKDGRNPVNHAREFLIVREWSEIILRRRIVNCLLCLLSLSTVFALVMVALIATGQVGKSGFVIGVVLAGTVGWLGKLLNTVLSSIFRKKD